MIVDQSLHGDLQDTACLHAEFPGNDLQDVAESVSDRPYAVETVGTVVGVTADNVVEESTEGVEHQIEEIGIGVQVLADEAAVLCTESVRERLCVDAVDQFVARASEGSGSQLSDLFGHLTADEVRDQPFTEVTSASLVTENKTQRIDILRDAFPVVETRVGPGPEDCGEAGPAPQQGAGGRQQVHGYEDLRGRRKNRAQRTAYELVLQFRNTCTVEIYLTDLFARESVGQRTENVLAHLLLRNVVRIVSLARKSDTVASILRNAGPIGLGRAAIGYQYHGISFFSFSRTKPITVAGAAAGCPYQ